MTRVVLEQTAIAAGRMHTFNVTAADSSDSAGRDEAQSGDVLSTACRELGDQMSGALEAAENLEKAWLLLMANPVVRIAYQRYQGIYCANGHERTAATVRDHGGNVASSPPRCNERVSDMLGTLRELNKLDPAEWNFLARDYAGSAVDPSKLQSRWSPARRLRQLASSLTGRG